jgi:hypothetical protein
MTDDTDPVPSMKPSREMFKGFRKGEVLVSYDFPLLQVLHSPSGKTWLASWRDSDDTGEDSESPGALHRWLILPVRAEVVKSLEENEIPLRDILETCPDWLYLVEGRDVLRPSKVKAIRSFQIGEDYLPKRNISIRGNNLRQLELPSIDRKRLVLDIRLSLKGMEPGKVSFFISGPVKESVQRILSSTGHSITETRMKVVDLAYGLGDAFEMCEVATTIGSYRIVAQPSNPDPGGDRKIVEALSLVKTLIDASSTGKQLGEVAATVGANATIQIDSLLKFVKSNDLVMTISWTVEGIEDSMVLDAVRASSLLAKLRPALAKLESSARLMVKLGPDEAERLRLPARGEGGMQSLQRQLQAQLTADGTLTITPVQVEKIVRYAQSYGEGGFQGRFQGILGAVKRMGMAFSEVR